MITYGSTTLTSYNTITKIEVYYYKSTSATGLSGGSWSTTKPTWENGKYIWQKIRTTYEGKLENGLYYSESDPVNITGQQGATGTAAYSYKLNASDTTITISKTGVYSTSKITFTATSKQGTGSVNAYAGRFKIETTANGTSWTASYTSSANESSKEYTVPTGIIAIRCSLYQAGGTSTLLDIVTIPILSDDRPIATKTYTGLIGSANDAANASFYFAKIHPDSYTTNYKVKMKVRVTAPEAYAETIDIQFGGYGNSFSSYDAYTTRTGSVGIYYINLYRATQAGISTNHKGHALGVGLRSSSNPTNTSYKRTIIIDILELDGCTIEMLDTAVKYANIDGTGSTNYYGLTEMAVGTTGQNATNNTNTNYTQYSNNVKAGTNGIKGYTLIMKDSENTWSCFYSGAYKKENTGKPVYTGGFMLGKILYSAGAGAQTSDSSLDTYYNYKSGVNTSTIYDAYPVDLRYSTNCASTLTSQRPVYIVGTIENDGLFHLDVSQWYTQTEPTYADGKVYVYVGMAYSTYQVWLSTENPAYTYYNGEFILYDKAQTLQNINTLKNSLETQIDSKVETWCQKTNPANSWSAEERPNHTGDLWYYIGESGTTYKNNTTYQYNGETNVWSAYSANPDLFDKIDGKSTIYYGTTSSVTSAEEGDYLVDSENDCTYRWNNGAWVLATDYKQVAIDAIEIGGRNLLLNTTINANNLSKIRANPCFSFAVEDGIDCYKTTGNNTAHLFNGTDAWDCLSEKLKANTTYTYSAWIKTNKTKALGYSQYGHFNVSNSASTKSDKTHEDIAEKRIFKPEIVEEGQWTKISITFTTNDLDGSSFGIYPVYNTGTDTILYTYGMKLEKGNIATDWTPAPEDVEESIRSYAQSIQSQVDGMAEIHYGTAVPTLSNAPYISWTDTATRDMHVDDLYYNTSTGYCYRFTKSGSTYSWTRIKDSDITAAATAASNANTAAGNAQTTANNANTLAGQKRRIFVNQPTPPYEVGDLWVEGSNGDIKKCKTARATGNYTASDWELASKYTDDTLASEANNKIDNLEIGGRNYLCKNPKAYTVSAYGAYDLYVTEPLEVGQTYTLQLWNVDVSHSAKTQEQLNVAVYYCGGSQTFGKWQGTEYFDNGHADHLVLTFTPNTTNINHSDVTNATKKFIRLYNSVPSATGTMSMTVGDWKLEKGNRATDWTPAPEDAQADIDTALAQSVEYIVGTQTAATGTWTGNTIDKELKVGKTIAYKLPYDGSGNANLILTLADGSVTNAIPVYLNNVRVTTHFKKDCIINMTYDGTAWKASSIPNSDTYNKTLYSQNVKASTATYTGTHIICGTSEGYCNIAPNVTFDLSYPLLYYATTATTTITTTANNHYLNIPGINFSINGTIENGVAYKQIYLKGTIFNNMFTIASSPFLTTKEPSNNDGYYYIPLGIMSSATVGRFVSSNMLYAYIDGAFQPVDTAAVLRAQDAKDLATAVYGTCSTGATTVDKVITCPNFTLFEGARIQITFTYANTAVASETTTNSPTLNVNGTGRKPIKIGIEEANTANPLYWAAGATIEFVYDGSAWILQNAPYTLYGTCNTEENVREKQVVCDGAVICKGTTIYVDMLYSNTADSNSENGNVTLNVANTIAKTIYANNATLTIRSRYNWNAGENPSFTFDGQYWQMDKDTVPAYITDKDEDGIFVHPINDTASGWSIGKVFELLNNGYSYIKMWLEDVTDNLSAKIRIGREDQHHILLDKEIIQFKKGDTPKELASFSSSGISFDEGVPFKIGNDSTYVQFVDNDSDGVADALEIVADKISFKNGGDDNTTQDIQERFNDLQTDISNITNNIEINPTANIPYVAITTQKDEYNAGLKLEPTQLSFQLNGQTTATIANDEMNIPTASVTNLFMQSANQSYEKIWVMRSNGHLSLKVGKQN